MGKEETSRYDVLPKPVKIFFLVATAFGVGLAVYYIFGLSIGGLIFYYDAEYYYLLFGIFGSCVFLIRPENRKLQWYDLVLSGLMLGMCIHFFLHAREMMLVGWIPASTFNLALACIFLLISLEAARRVVGPAFPAVVAIIGLYPLVASHMPGVFEGISYSFGKTVSAYVFGGEGLIGIPGSVMGGILIGFLVLVGVLLAAGAGEFFLNVAVALFGKYRGGPAKVAVVASGFFGSLSGSIFANVVATGSVTIPAMKRMGYPPHYAGAIEACASTGGPIMPPVMGAVAFIMCVILDMPYHFIIAAAAVPAILYYFGLLAQVDAYAARVGLKGLPEEELPSLWGAMKKGWPFVIVFVFLIWGLVYMRWEFLTPFYASVLLLLLSFFSRETMMTPKRLVNTLVTIGKVVSMVAGIFLPVGIMMAATTMTGVGSAFTSGAVGLGGGSMLLVMALGVIACYLMGMAGMGVLAYIFLAVTLAPAIILMGGLNTLAVHLFILYVANTSAITPPVAGAAFLAASLAGADGMKTALTSMRLGIVIYFIPFFFVFNPALILEGPILETLYLFILCLLGILFIAAALEGYLLKVGELELWARPLLGLGGFLIAFPNWTTTVIGAALAAVVILVTITLKGKRQVRRTDN